VSGIVPLARWGVHNNDVDTTARAILERVLLCKDTGTWQRPPVVKQYVWDTMLYGFKKELLKHSYCVEPYSKDAFVSSYEGRRKTRMQKAADSLDLVELDFRDVRLSTFIKAEKIPFHKKPDPAPRVIQPRTSRFHVAYGCFIKPIEKIVYKAIDAVFGSRTVMKGLNALQVGTIIHNKWRRFRRPVAVPMDASRFDQHVHKSSMLWVKGVLSNFIPKTHRRSFGRLFDWKLFTKARAVCQNGVVQYTVDYGLCSGDMDTSLIGVLDMCALLYTYKHQKSIDCEVVDMGDDSVVIMEQDDLDWFMYGLEDWFRLCGFNIVAEEPVYELEHISFCQCRPIYNGEQYMMVHEFPNAWSKDVCTLLPLKDPKTFDRWLTAVGLCGSSWLGGIPIYSEFYSKLIKCDNPLDHPMFEDNSDRYWARGIKRSGFPVHPSTRASFYLAFGITPDEQIALERAMVTPTWTNPVLLEGNLGFDFYG